MTRLGDALEFIGVPERIDHPERERFVTVKLNGGGAVQRNIGQGKTPVPFTGYRVHSGDLIYSRIDARNGAFAVVPEDLDGSVVSKDFPIFKVKSGQVDKSYLAHFFRSGTAESLIRARSRGATNRQRIKEDEFLGLPFLFPQLGEQRRIASILDNADSIRAKRRQVLAHLDDLTQSIFYDMFGSPEQRVALGELGVRFRSGKSVAAALDPNCSVARVIKVSAVSSGIFDATESKPLPKSYQPPEAHRIKKGDVLFARASGSADLIGATALVDREHPGLYLPDKVWRLELNPTSPLRKMFVFGALGQARAKAYFRDNSSGSSGVKNISQATVLKYRVGAPSLEDQLRYERVMSRFSLLRRRAADEVQEVDELFASLQSRAFKGEL